MPAELTADGLGIGCVFSNGTRSAHRADHLPCPRLVRDMLIGLAGLVHPHGTVDSAGTVDNYVSYHLRHVARWLDQRGFDGGVADLTGATLLEYWLGLGAEKRRHEHAVRRMIRGFDAQTGALPEDVRRLVTGRPFARLVRPGQLAPYSEAEWAALIGACRRVVDASFAAHRAALVAARRGDDPRDGGWTRENLCWLLARLGPVGTAGVARHWGVSTWTVEQARVPVPEATAELFPHPEVVIAYRLLFGAYTGVVPDGVDGLGIDGIDWAGDASVLLSYVKGRTATESLTLSRPAVRLLERWLEHSALLRTFAPPEIRDRLWLRTPRRGAAGIGWKPADSLTVARWVERHRVVADDGAPLRVHKHRIRTTFESLRDRRTWSGSGRATIDPNHSPQVEGDHYLSATTPAQQRAVDSVIEDAQNGLVRRAQTPTVLGEESTVELVRDYPQLVARLGLDDEAVAELVGGDRDVFVAGCADQLASPFGVAGKPCPARPWVCLLCPLAVFAPRHAANLLRLKAFFARQWRQLPRVQFMQVFGPYATRVDEVLDRFEPQVKAAALREVAATDDELPLRPEERTA